MISLRLPADGPLWLRAFADSIVRAFSSIMPAPFRLKDYATADLPPAAEWKQGLVWDVTLGTVKWSDGTSWAAPQPSDATLTALAAYNTDGLLTQTAPDTFTGRTIGGTANEITVTNGNGVSGNPVISIPAAVTFTGKTLTGGTYASVAGLTTSVDATINGRAVGTGGQSSSTVLGGTVSGTSAVAVGSGASAVGNGTAVGQGATASGNVSVAIGIGATTGGFSGSIAIGRASTCTANGQCVIGNSANTISNYYWGSGVTAASPQSFMFHGSGASGTDIAGGNFTIAGGKGTGAGAPGNILFSTSTAGASSATLQSLTTRVTISPTAVNMGSGVALQSGGTQVVTSRRTGWTADTGTDKRTANATYAGTAEVAYTQATIQALMDAVRDATQTIKALKADLTTHGLIGA